MIATTLAQQTLFGQLQSARPTPLPDPPALEHSLLEAPAVPALVALGLGVLIALALHRTGRGRGAILAALAFTVLAGGVVLCAALVTTTRERLIERSRRVIELGMGAKGDELGAMLDPDVRVVLLGRDAGLDRAGIIQRVRDDLAARHGVSRADVGECRAHTAPTANARVQIACAFQTAAGLTPAVWMFVWRRAEGDWRLWQIEAQQIGLMGPGSVGELR